ncbi:MAG: hypothetical protein IPP22_04345 [Nitrosomonas sp.]|nr:hypothetical protein [Nitrosomonas sp.]
MIRPLRLEFPNALYHVKLRENAAQHKGRRMAIIAVYKTGAYSQQEIGENYQLHPTNDGPGCLFARIRILGSGPRF